MSNNFPRRVTRKPTRRDLLKVVTTLQGLIGEASAHHANDRDGNGFEKGQKKLDEALALCIEARGFDDPAEPF